MALDQKLEIAEEKTTNLLHLWLIQSLLSPKYQGTPTSNLVPTLKSHRIINQGFDTRLCLKQVSKIITETRSFVLCIIGYGKVSSPLKTVQAFWYNCPVWFWVKNSDEFIQMSFFHHPTTLVQNMKHLTNHGLFRQIS